MAQWIWYSGDFEIYHSFRIHTRREEYGCHYPSFWHLSRPETVVTFHKDCDAAEDTEFTVISQGQGRLNIDGVYYGIQPGRSYPLSRGHHEIFVTLTDEEAFPALFIDHPFIHTDGTWTADCQDKHVRPVGCVPAYEKASDRPGVFPFSYRSVEPVAAEELEGGTLYDYGVETFGPVTVERKADNGRITVVYGESRTEALDVAGAILSEELPADEGIVRLRSRAFRYIFLRSEQGHPVISAELEYLPIEDIASFSCDDEMVSRVWDIAVRTFHLNTRECYMDGIKRDRWVWSGDAYQSYMVNRYLYFYPEENVRTIRGLLGRQPYLQHINTINDYSLYLIIAVRDEYRATGDISFVRSVWEEVSALYRFIVSRLDRETGYMVQREGDWIFIDWADIDKEGPLCAEQILLWETYGAMEELSRVLGLEPEDYEERAAALKAAIFRDFWDGERSAFIDSYTSGRRHITRHANIFAILYDFTDPKTAREIYDAVLCGDLAEPITTPYFKLFELLACGKMGDVRRIQDYIDSYWGGMVALGATTVWEQYLPTESGTEHLDMYGQKYGRSLCHAWGSGPILLLGQSIAGVRQTDVAYRTFSVKPEPGRYGEFHAVVPVFGGTVKVDYRDGHVCVLADREGGTLTFGGTSVPLPACVPVTL